MVQGDEGLCHVLATGVVDKAGASSVKSIVQAGGRWEMRATVLSWPLELLIRLVLKVLNPLCRLVGDELGLYVHSEPW